MKLSPHELGWLALRVGGWTDESAVIAVAVALAESGGDTEALGRSTVGVHIGNRDHGLWQISGAWHGEKLARYRWRDPYDNCRMARIVYDEFALTGRSGWSAWTVYNTAAHTPFVADAALGVRWPSRPYNPQTTAWRS